MREKKKLTVIMSLHELDLAGKISDKILCINGKYVEKFGTPEEVFKPGYIADLFSIATGSFAVPKAAASGNSICSRHSF